MIHLLDRENLSYTLVLSLATWASRIPKHQEGFHSLVKRVGRKSLTGRQSLGNTAWHRMDILPAVPRTWPTNKTQYAKHLEPMVLFGDFVLFLTPIKLFCEPYQPFHSTLVTPFRKEENTPSSGYATNFKWGSDYTNKSRSTLHLCLSKLSGKKASILGKNR